MLEVLELLLNGNCGGNGPGTRNVCFFSALLQCFCDMLALRTVANFLGKIAKHKMGLQTS